jgi:alkylhydroperoxidase family enzyme
MTHFPIHTIDTAPEASRPSLKALKEAFGFVPNIAGAMATSPVLIASLTDLFARVHGGSFSEKEIQILLLTNAVTNDAEWPIALHSFLALKEGMDQADVDSIRNGGVPRDPRQAALSSFARSLITTRGHVDETAISTLLNVGFDQRHALEVVAVVAASTITNYAASVTKPPIEASLSASV